MDASSSAPYPAATESLGSRVRALLTETRELARDHLELAALEAQRASVTFTRMIMAAVVISILVISAWISLVAGGLVWATETGISWPVALLIAAVVNLVLAGVLGWYIYSHVDELLFEATLRQLRRSKQEVKQMAGAAP
jgi:uncharacterized membrane protein YqjE